MSPTRSPIQTTIDPHQIEDPGSNKRRRLVQDDVDTTQEDGQVTQGKRKRGAKACLVCRGLKMRCVNSDNPPCDRCRGKGIDCVFTEGAPSGVYTINSAEGSNSQGDAFVNGPVQIPPEDQQPIPNLTYTALPTENPFGSYPYQANSFMSTLASAPDNSYAGQNSFGFPLEPTAFSSFTHSGTAAIGSSSTQEVYNQSHFANDANSGGMTMDAELRALLETVGLSCFSTGEYNGGDAQSILPSKNTATGPSTIEAGSVDSSHTNTSRSGRDQDLQNILKVISEQQIEDSFNWFFAHINMGWSLFQPDYHTVSLVKERSPFLLLTICTVALRYHNSHSQAYAILYERARAEAANFAIRRVQCVGTIQAYLLLAMYAVHPLKENSHDEDIGWSFICLASRLALDLRLYRSISMTSPQAPSRAEDLSKENDNRARTWLLCCVLDRSYSLSRGRTASLCLSMKPAPWNDLTPGGLGIASYMELLVIISDALDAIHVENENQSGGVGVGAIIAACDVRVKDWRSRLVDILRNPAISAVLSSEHMFYLSSISEYYQSYWSMVVFSFGLQDAVDKKSSAIGYYFQKCAEHALNVIAVAETRLAKQSHFRHSPDNRFVFLTYSMVTLLKFTRADLQMFCPPEAPFSTFNVLLTLERLATLMENVSVDRNHMASFCSVLLRTVGKEIAVMNAMDSSSGLPQLDLARILGEGGPQRASEMRGIAPLVQSLLSPKHWESLVVAGFDSRERPSTCDFLHTGSFDLVFLNET